MEDKFAKGGVIPSYLPKELEVTAMQLLPQDIPHCIGINPYDDGIYRRIPAESPQLTGVLHRNKSVLNYLLAFMAVFIPEPFERCGTEVDGNHVFRKPVICYFERRQLVLT